MTCGLLFDTSSLRRVNDCVRLAKYARSKGKQVAVGTPQVAELLRQWRIIRSEQGLSFDAMTVIGMLKSAEIDLLPFEEADAVALEAWTNDRIGGQQEYQSWKARQVLRALGGLLSREGVDPEVVDTAGVRVPSTADWLMIGLAQRHALCIVTEEKRKPYWEFEGVDTLDLEQALREQGGGSHA